MRISRRSGERSSGTTYLSSYWRTARPETISPFRRRASCTWLSRYRKRPKRSNVANERSAKPRSSNPKRRVKTSPTCGSTETRATPSAIRRLRSRPNLLYPPLRYLRTPYIAKSAATMMPAKRTCSAVIPVPPRSSVQICLRPVRDERRPAPGSRGTCRRDCIERAVKCKSRRRKCIVLFARYALSVWQRPRILLSYRSAREAAHQGRGVLYDLIRALPVAVLVCFVPGWFWARLLGTSADRAEQVAYSVALAITLVPTAALVLSRLLGTGVTLAVAEGNARAQEAGQ